MTDPRSVVDVCSKCASAHTSTAWADLVKTVASAVAIPLGIVTFYLGYRQRERDRKRAYYQDVVVDKLLPDLLDFFDASLSELNQEGHRAVSAVTEANGSLPASSKQVLGTFGQKLFAQQDRLLARVVIFDEVLAERIPTLFMKIQDDITSWFGDIDLRKRRSVAELDSLLRAGEKQVVRTLYSGDFRPQKSKS